MPPTNKALLHHAIPIFRVANLATSLDYYTRILGFTIPWQLPYYASVKRGTCSLMLCEGGQGNPGTWIWAHLRRRRPLRRMESRRRQHPARPHQLPLGLPRNPSPRPRQPPPPLRRRPKRRRTHGRVHRLIRLQYSPRDMGLIPSRLFDEQSHLSRHRLEALAHFRRTPDSPCRIWMA